MDIFEWDENIPATANNLNEMQNIINNNIIEDISTTEEIVTNKTCDGKPIYRKTFTGSISGVTSNAWVNLEQCGINAIVDKMIKIEGTITNTKTDARILPANAYEDGTYHISFSYLKSTDYLQVRVSGWNNTQMGFEYIIILEYTKITD